MNLLPLDEIVFQAEPRRYITRGQSYRSVTDYLTEVLGDPFADVPQDRLEFCQGRGNGVHLAGALLVKGKLDWNTVDPRIHGYVKAIENFHRDCPGKIVYTEKRLVSLSLGLGGTPDLVKFIGGHRSLIDYKTSQQMTPRMRLQTVGYQLLHNCRYPFEPIYKRYGLRLNPDATYKLIAHDDPYDAAAFDCLLKEAKAREAAEQWKDKYR